MPKKPALAQQEREQGTLFVPDGTVPNGLTEAPLPLDVNPLILTDEPHVTVIASTGSGRGIGLVHPNLLRFPKTFAINPKGELPQPNEDGQDGER